MHPAQAMGELHEDKAQELKRSVQAGAYRVDAMAVADAIMRRIWGAAVALEPVMARPAGELETSVPARALDPAQRGGASAGWDRPHGRARGGLRKPQPARISPLLGIRG
jgi:hypothetical protein